MGAFFFLALAAIHFEALGFRHVLHSFFLSTR
jgi:hypothetical protein